MSIRLDGRAQKFMKGDRIETKTKRRGRILEMYGEDTARIKWDDGPTFSIRTTHLTLIDEQEKKTDW